MSMKRASTYGGHGIDLQLSHAGNTDRVFWSENGNSFVFVSHECGPHITADGECVLILCINGIGEIRWECDGSFISEHEGAAKYFNLKRSTLKGRFNNLSAATKLRILEEVQEIYNE